jgi:hypothetical protein
MNDLNIFELKDFLLDPETNPVHCTLVIGRQEDPVPAPRWGHAAASINNEMYILGGRNEKDMDDITVFNGDTMRWKKIEIVGDQPNPRRRHSIAFINSALVLFGGFNGQFHSDLYICDFVGLGECQKEVENGTLAEDVASLIRNPDKSTQEIHFQLDSGEKLNVHKSMMLFRSSLSGISGKQITGQTFSHNDSIISNRSISKVESPEVSPFYKQILKMNKGDIMQIRNIKNSKAFELFVQLHYCGTLVLPISIKDLVEVIEISKKIGTKNLSQKLERNVVQI